MSSYYRSTAPNTWGTSNYRFGYPPEPLFRPQPTWGGLDYYQAHAVDPDPTLYHRIQEGRYDAEGVGLNEARHWHRQAYGGFGDIRVLSSHGMGHAAAYEAYRIWIHNRSMSDLRPDFGQRREAFVALAVAEVSHLFPNRQVHHERRKFREACETAAATASTIFHTLQLEDDEYPSDRSHISSSSFGRSGSTSSDDDLYAFDEHAMPQGLRHRRRSSSVSFSSRPTMIPPNTSPYQPISSVPIPVNQPSYSYSGGSPYQAGGSPYQTGGSPYSNSSPFNGPSSYPQQYPGSLPMVGSTYDPNQALLYQGSGSYPQHQQAYIQAQPGMGQTVPMAPGSTIVIQQPSQQSSRHKRHHRHRSGSRDSRRRHRSHSDVYLAY